MNSYIPIEIDAAGAAKNSGDLRTLSYVKLRA